MTQSLYDLYNSDTDVEANGAWVPVGPSQFKLARAGGGNKKFKAHVAKKFRPYQTVIQNGTMPPDLAEQLVRECFVECIVLDWKDVVGRDGSAIEFSKESCSKLLCDLPNLFEELQRLSQDASNFQATVREAMAGN